MTHRITTLLMCCAITGCSSLGMSTAAVDERISQISNSQDAWTLAKEIEEAENAESIYSHVLSQANQGDLRVDLACAVIK